MCIRDSQRETHFGWAINAQQLASRSQPASKDRFKRVGRCVPPCSAVFWVPWGRKRAFEKPILNSCSCPAGQTLTSFGTWYTTASGLRYQLYEAQDLDCRSCKLRGLVDDS